MNKSKALLLLVLVFAAGIAVGVVGTRTLVRHLIRDAVDRPETVRLMMERRLDRRLGLNADQQAKLHEILIAAHEQMRGLRREFRPRLAGVVGEANREIIAILTPEQRDQFEKMKAQNPVFWRAGQERTNVFGKDADSN